MRKLLFILPVLFFLACSSDNEPMHEEEPPQPREWLKDILLIDGVASNVETRWNTKDSLIHCFFFNHKYVDIRFYSTGGGYIDLNRKWYIENINHLFIQDIRNSADYVEYIVEPIISDSTLLKLTGVGDYEGRNLEINLSGHYASWIRDKLLANGKYTSTVWDTNDTVISYYIFDRKSVTVRFSPPIEWIGKDGSWYIDSMNHLFVQDRRGYDDYTEYLVEPINPDSTTLRFTDIGDSEGRSFEITPRRNY